MRCISLWQPWASLLVAGVKLCETRSWQTPFRGPLLIHAAKKWNTDLAEIAYAEPFNSALRSLGVMWSEKRRPDLPFGCIVGRVEVVECYATEDVDFDHAGLDVTPNDPVWEYKPTKLRLWHEQKPFGDFSPGRFVWLCKDPVRFKEPVPFIGRQGFFDVDVDSSWKVFEGGDQ